VQDPSLADPGREAPGLPGWPGYRTAAGHSSLDPVEASAEGGHVLGVLLRDLLLMRLRPRSLAGRLGLLLVGLLTLAPFAIALYQSLSTGVPDFDLLIWTAIPGLFGVYCLANLGLSLSRRRRR
jgi:hypothetical protein